MNERRSGYSVWTGLILLLSVMTVLSACGPGTETPTPTPPGTPGPTSTPAPAPIETYYADDFGVTWSSGYYEGQYTNNPPQQWAADAGATWDRWDIHWNWVMQTRPGATPPVWAGQSPGEPSYTYSYPEAIDGAGTTSPALNVLAVLNGGLLPADQIGPHPYDEGGTWQAFVEAAYEQYGSQVAAWELGNETGFVHEDPNDPDSQPPLTPEEYARRGGTIVAFAQQHGYERAVLLTANGYRLTAVVIIVNCPPPPACATA